jgi:archaellum component FlaC
MKYLFILLLLPIFGFAQKSENRENIRNAKVGMITNRLDLSTEQAPKFWVVYNEYEKETKAIRQKLKKLTEDTGSLTTTDDKIAKNVNLMLDLRQQEVNVEKDYFEKFKKVISIRQYAELKRTEKAFNQLLINKLNRMQKQEEDN